jgi:SAM-dependent methyltransferase
MNSPSRQTVQAYYDERVQGKIRDFTDANPRIEAAIALIAEWAPVAPRRVLEVGCGIGATSWRMARAWPDAEVIGTDFSPLSIDVAKTCFRRSNLAFHCGPSVADTIGGHFDLVVLMDVYEHIAVADRPSLHAALNQRLAEESRLIVTVPTPAILAQARVTDPSGLQPVDEDVDIAVIQALAGATRTELLYYRQVGIWDYGDYAHVVLGRFQALAEVTVRRHRPKGLAGLRRRVKDLLSIDPTASNGRRGYLGDDVLDPSSRDLLARFRVSARARHRLAASWSPHR